MDGRWQKRESIQGWLLLRKPLSPEGTHRVWPLVSRADTAVTCNAHDSGALGWCQGVGDSLKKITMKEDRVHSNIGPNLWPWLFFTTWHLRSSLFQPSSFSPQLPPPTSSLPQVLLHRTSSSILPRSVLPLGVCYCPPCPVLWGGWFRLHSRLFASGHCCPPEFNAVCPSFLLPQKQWMYGNKHLKSDLTRTKIS